jgi:hypothetical protein
MFKILNKVLIIIFFIAFVSILIFAINAGITCVYNNNYKGNMDYVCKEGTK